MADRYGFLTCAGCGGEAHRIIMVMVAGKPTCSTECGEKVAKATAIRAMKEKT